MKPYSLDLRQRVLADCDAGMGTLIVAVKYRVSDSWVRRLKQRRRESGEVAARVPRSKPKTKLMAQTERLAALVADRPDATLEELRAALGIEVSVSTVWRALRDLRLTFKKK
jgi:transposase